MPGSADLIHLTGALWCLIGMYLPIYARPRDFSRVLKPFRRAFGRGAQ
jgi:hypothetical protein